MTSIDHTELRTITDSARCLFDKDAVEAGLDKLATSMQTSLADKDPIFLCVVIGGIITMGRLLPKLHFPLQLDYIHVSRYADKASGSHTLAWKAKPSLDLANRHVVIVDDILDGGITMSSIQAYCDAQGAEKTYSAVLVNKPEGRHPEGTAHPDFAALTVGKEWLIGSGMDYKGYLRNLDGIYALDPDTIEQFYSS
jgi:hypoxanthine phosphoribosyltransferase